MYSVNLKYEQLDQFVSIQEVAQLWGRFQLRAYCIAKYPYEKHQKPISMFDYILKDLEN